MVSALNIFSYCNIHIACRLPRAIDVLSWHTARAEFLTVDIAIMPQYAMAAPCMTSVVASLIRHGWCMPYTCKWHARGMDLYLYSGGVNFMVMRWRYHDLCVIAMTQSYNEYDDVYHYVRHNAHDVNVSHDGDYDHESSS